MTLTRRHALGLLGGTLAAPYARPSWAQATTVNVYNWSDYIGETTLADFEKGIGAKVVAKIPFAPDVFMAVSRDIPALKHKQHHDTKALCRLIGLIVPEAVSAAAPTEKKSLLSFFAKKD